MNPFCVRGVVKTLENAIFYPKLDEPNDASVFDVWAQNFKQLFVINVFKKVFYIGF